MKLKSLRLHGFKSFPDATRVVFHDGITAIVGPNGCGKSNIGDAIRWVLGEQRPTAVRGARMDEVIFQGAAGRRAAGRASVAMVVTNADGALAVPYDEVEIGRSVHRDGGSDYRLNRSSCRLRDIVDLCRDTGLGANAYSIIEIRMIDAILSERTDERRLLFEEAAGVGRYKGRRNTTLRRLEASENDLQRIDDVIGEVRTKVRSLARQKGTAERHRTLRDRRLALDATLAGIELEALSDELRGVEAELVADQARSVEVSVELAAVEVKLEDARGERDRAAGARASCAQETGEVASELGRTEMKQALADERIAAGARRLERIAEAQARLNRQRLRAEDDSASLEAERVESRAALQSAAAALEERQRAAEAVRGRLEEARRALQSVEDEHRDAVRRIAAAEGERESARRQVADMERRAEHLDRDARRAERVLRDLESQCDLFSDRRAAAAADAEAAKHAFEASREGLAEARRRLESARKRERDEAARAVALEARLEALGGAPDADGGAVAVVDALRRAFPDAVLGPVSAYLKAPPDLARGLDALVGGTGAAVVVRARSDCEALARWHAASESAARLVLLPLDAAPDPAGELPAGVEAAGEGAAWVRALLGGAVVDGAAARDVRGAVHLAPPRGPAGDLERRARIETIEAERDDARRRGEDFRAARISLEAECAEAGRDADAASERWLASRDAARAAESESVTRNEESKRLEQRGAELSRRLDETRRALDFAVQRRARAESEATRLAGRRDSLSRRTSEARAARDAVEAQWEEVREAASEARILAARIESRLERVEGQVRDARDTLAHAGERLDDLAARKDDTDAEIAEQRGEREGFAEAIQDLFRRRDDLQRLLADRDQAMEAASRAVEQAEGRLRELQGRERDSVRQRHELELRRQDVRNRADRVGERIEAEWGRPAPAIIDEVEPVEGDPGEMRIELEGIVARLGRMGPVNMLAVEEHQEEVARLEFLVGQREDLVQAREDLRAAIRRINATATELFTTSFEAIRENFTSTFMRLFDGGRADLRLADPENPLESPIEIHAAPQGKRTRRIDLLSGGERALTALALLFGIYLVKPSPFCVLDEVDAPLDEANIGRFIRLLHSFKADSQFVVITHNPRTIEAADWIYGVTMEEPGVSSIVGVQLGVPEG